MIDLTEVVVAVLTLIISLIAAYLIPYIKAKVSGEKLETAKVWVKIAVQAAEMIFKGNDEGAAKKKYVQDVLKNMGFSINIDQVEHLIESAVWELNEGLFLGGVEVVQGIDVDDTEEIKMLAKKVLEENRIE